MDYKKLFDLSGRVAVVIGAGSGIGQSAAKGLAAHGAVVVCADSNSEAATATAQQIDGRARALSVDIRQSEDVSKLFSSIIENEKRLDVVVTAPGAYDRKAIST